MSWPPETRYAKGRGGHVAYQVHGSGPVDILVAFGHMVGIEDQVEGRHSARLLRRLANLGRIVRFDRRGTGRSDPLDSFGPGRLEEWVDDALTVLDAVGAKRAALVGFDPAGASGALLLAAAHPERATHLVLGHAVTRARASLDDSDSLAGPVIGDADAAADRWVDSMVEGDHQEFLSLVAPSSDGDDEFHRWYATAQRRFASPRVRRAIYRAWLDLDLRPLLASISVPTLVVHREGAELFADHASTLVESIPGARRAAVPGADGMLYVGAVEPVASVIGEFITGTRASTSSERVLATVLFTDIVESTKREAALGDRAWADLLEEHDAMVRRQLDRHRGVMVKSLGDGILATFDGPGRAIDAALDIGREARGMGLELRAGIHTGEVQRRGNDIVGIAVNIAARVVALAGGGEVLVSRTVRDLVAGADFQFSDRGERDLKGVAESWRLFAVAPQSADGSIPPIS